MHASRPREGKDWETYLRWKLEGGCQDSRGFTGMGGYLGLHSSGPQPGYPLAMGSAPQYTQFQKVGAHRGDLSLSEIWSFDF